MRCPRDVDLAVRQNKTSSLILAEWIESDGAILSYDFA
jgi:hypothetical protein